MARHATRFAGRRRRNNGRAGAARRSLSLSLSLSIPRRPGGRKVGRRAIPIPTSRNPFACMPRAAPPTHRIVGSHPSRPSPLLAPPGSNPRTGRPKGGGHVETLSLDSPRTTPIVSLSLCLSLFPSSVLLLLSLLLLLVVGPHAPQSNATRATANRFPFPEAIGRLPPNNPPSSTHSTVARAPPRRRTSLSRSTCPGPETQVGSWPGRCLG